MNTPKIKFLCIAALLIAVNTASHAQRNLGALGLRLDDGAGNSLTVKTPSSGWTGNVDYILPVPPYPGGPSGWVAPGTLTGQVLIWNAGLNSWQPTAAPVGAVGIGEPFLTFAADLGSLANNRVVTNGSGISIVVGGTDNSAFTISNSGVLSLTGTANQVSVNAGVGPVTGAVTLALPQNINTGASPTFNGLTLSGLSAGGVVKAMAGTGTLTLASTVGTTFVATWMEDNVPKNATNVQMTIAHQPIHPETTLPYGGSIVAVTIASDGAVTGGTLDVEVTKNGVGTGFKVTLNSASAAPANQYLTATQAAGVTTFNANDRIGLQYTTPGTYLPNNALHITCAVLVQY